LPKVYKWMFIGDIPLLYEARKVAQQLEIEIWLDPSSLLRTLNLKPVSQEKLDQHNYVM